MIVICTKCKAKFRVADERIAPRGAKVRCSRCQNVFVVQREAPPPDPTPAPPPPAAADDPFAVSPDPFAVPFPAPGPVPFGVEDPLGGADPFAAAEPFAPLQATAAGSTLPVTDLSDLLGPPAPAAAPSRAVPPPLPAAAPGASPPAEPSVASGFGDLALEDRHTPRPVKLAPFPEPPMELDGEPAFAATFDPGVRSIDPFTAGDGFGPGGFELAPDPGEPAPGFGEGAPDDVRTPPPASPPVQPGAVPERRSEAIPAPVVRPAGPALAAAERIPGERSSRLRAIAVNALALLALLGVALALLVVWRTDGSFHPGALRPSAVLAALRGPGADAPFGAEEVRSGIYERERGAPLLFVRGKVVSRAPGPVPAVEVSVEVVRGGAVIARGEATAGGVPTAEELYLATDAASLARAASAARRRAPREVGPGDALPFLVTLGDAPADLEGAALRVELAPAAGRPR